MVQVIVPTRNASKGWSRFAPALLACVLPGQVLIVDSESTDDTVELALAAGFDVRSTALPESDDGGTQQRFAEELPEAEILVYMTQDAVLASPDAVSTLAKAFDDPRVGAAYGRQLARAGAGAIEAHGRAFDYPEGSDVRSLASRERLGIRAIFLSNAFAAYRRSALMDVGGFPAEAIVGEDTIVAAEMLLGGWKLAYVAEARVLHSRDASAMQEFRRCFDLGVLHSREHWLIDGFGGLGNEGRRFLVSELKYLRERDPGKIPAALLRAGIKGVGYGLGRMESRLTPEVKRRLSLHPGFWAQ
jgi:rhamnosyltransferase